MEKKIKPIGRIGSISNNYGRLVVMTHEDKYYWLIEDRDTNFDNINDWGEIDKELYDSLIAYVNRITQPAKNKEDENSN